jgi:ribosomal silencing factor RsfS
MASISQHHQQTRILVQAAAAVCEDKKGLDTRILELDPIDAGLSDFFLVTSATNDRQAIAIADEIEHRLKKEFGVFPNSVEGRPTASGFSSTTWILWSTSSSSSAALFMTSNGCVNPPARSLPPNSTLS